MKKEEIQHYINNFRRQISIYLKPDLNLRAVIYPSKEGAIIEFEFKKNQPTKDEFKKEEDTISDQLAKIQQNAFGGNLKGFQFTGTNIVLEPTKILIIKNNDKNEWTSSKAEDDVKKLLNPQDK
ncbi:MAG: hypothetical protein A3D31_06595 [Candidatus Fluviicola riflensis]|nr:MAG: hypothetical protein CHH17_08415 [Candidatus Fluviicola riflensis]OGS79628.1 MAG: hypothetical protein A3D31_06595 [Candidatus Fluviicola riflensis]OGS87059.1 MAG: hypothetical protein A2724_06055 [Fluviicola sp. RIFCSPHIGHO2_01_FULL_43_53]OGS89851.1 MAG: hypothetical protein A3E30_02805 [Fluviicola sp. RIFCSPHIGHO2_12_FULL_43_24]